MCSELSPDMREYTYSRKEFFLISVITQRKLLLAFFPLLWAVHFATPLYEYGLGILYHPVWLIGESLTPLGVALLCVTLALAFLYTRLGRAKWLNIPHYYGITPEAMYISCAYYDSRISWSHYHGWSEHKGFFELYDDSRKMIVPKALFSEKELVAIRSYLSEQACP